MIINKGFSGLKKKKKTKIKVKKVKIKPVGSPEVNQIEKIKFAHPSEKECARILDFYKIKWFYEPKSFPVEWDKKGRVVQSFTPDFYLPDLGLYIELTTMSQKLVTKKNRKVRKLRELYPNINIKIFYQRDFRNLLLKYGLHKKASS